LYEFYHAKPDEVSSLRAQPACKRRTTRRGGGSRPGRWRVSWGKKPWSNP